MRICGGYRAQEVAGVEEARVEEADLRVRGLLSASSVDARDVLGTDTPTLEGKCAEGKNVG